MLPEWIKARFPSNLENYNTLSSAIEKSRLHTVCQEARCPNIYKCFSDSALTFMLLGNICTRRCSYCNVRSGIPLPPDEEEAKRIAAEIKKLKLHYAVLTSVTRDDLDDGGAGFFVKAVNQIKKINPGCRVELLISDLRGSRDALKRIVDAAPDVIGHNLEVVKPLFPKVRPQGDYKRSIEVLKNIKKFKSNCITKSGMMIGFGESKEEIAETLRDILDTGCNIMTIGQYLSPGPAHAKVEKFYTPEEFAAFKKIGEELGFECVESEPLVRSSYRAKESYLKMKSINFLARQLLSGII